ncbi:tRNA-dihydrouridine synthase family protein [Candidatus Saccharibacteria bacterium]|nr:tRNA-dihydrouridine synthase family protein [Candidatus Saccharibacteria bacterium]
MSNFWDDLPHGFTILAPMEGVTDVVFRQVIARAGRPDVFFTEFTNVSSFASEKGRHDALERLDIAGKNIENPIVAQIWGKNPEHFAETAQHLEGLGFDGLDINMGCPDRHVNKAGGGAAMIKTPELAIECIKRAKESTNLPVSIKTRIGFTFRDEYIEWIPLLLRQNLSALTVHLRTRKEMSKVPAHYDLIPDILRFRDEIAPETKLIINGDIKDLTDVRRLSKQFPGVDGFMIGRGVFQNPYCFTNHQPTQVELEDLFLYHLDLFDARSQELESRGSRYPYEPIKHFIKVYFSGFDGASELRNRLMNCKTTEELRQIIQKD